MATVMLDEKYAVYAEAISDLAAFDSDYASKANDVGFSRFDAAVGHALANMPFAEWTPAQLAQARRILQRYKNTQLPGLGYEWEKMPEVEDQMPVRDAGTRSPGYANIALEDGAFLLQWGGADPYFKERVEDARTMPGSKYDKVLKAWRVPVSLTTIDAIAQLMAKYAGTDLPFSESQTFRGGVEQYIAEVESKLHASAADNVSRETLKLHRAKDADKVRPFQLAGIKFAVENKQTIIADDMGLGKTVQSILSVAEADAFPALVICPASLKLNWKREIEMWVKDGQNGAPVIYIAEGSKPKGDIPAGVDFLIINYDIMHGWKDALIDIDWQAVIADECHYLKTETSRRTKAVAAVMKKVEPEYRLMLTGTPILNKPIEMWPVLGMIDGQKQFGGWFKFAMRYCGLAHNGFGYSATGATNLDELNTHLRSSGLMVRRRKEDVLKELPDKQWAKVPVPFYPATLAKAYDNAERDLEKFLREMSDADENEQMVRAAALQRIATLRQIAWRGKEKAIREWIDGFLETGKKLIVFGWHREAVEAIANHYDAPRIMGGMNKQEVEDGKDRFQNDPECRIIVCNIAAGGVGHTLTAASDVLFIEYAWNYALMDQAISRAHRIGQKDTVTGWMLAATLPDGRETIDHEMIEVIEAKETIVKQAIDGDVEKSAETMRARLRSLLQDAEADNAIGQD